MFSRGEEACAEPSAFSDAHSAVDRRVKLQFRIHCLATGAQKAVNVAGMHPHTQAHTGAAFPELLELCFFIACFGFPFSLRMCLLARVCWTSFRKHSTHDLSKLVNNEPIEINMTLEKAADTKSELRSQAAFKFQAGPRLNLYKLCLYSLKNKGC